MASSKKNAGMITEEMEFSGDIHFNDTLVIKGKISGSISSNDGTLILSSTGQVTGTIVVNTCVVYGRVEGEVSALSLTEVARTGEVSGKIITRNLLIAKGGVVEGTIEMSQSFKLQEEKFTRPLDVITLANTEAEPEAEVDWPKTSTK